MKAGTRVFMGLSVRDNALVIDDKHSPDLANCRINDKIGALSNIQGIEKYNSVSYGNAIVAIHQLNGHIFSLSGSKLFEGYPVPPPWTTLGGFYYPRALYYDSTTEYIYVVVDLGSNEERIIKTKINGDGWTEYGSQGSGVGQFLSHQNIWYDPSSEYMYIADCGNHRIVKTKLDGSWTGWTTLGGFINPFDICYDPASEFCYVANKGNHKIVKTKIDGSGWTTYGSYGTGVGQFRSPYGIYYDPASEYIYVADASNHRVAKTKIDGTGWTTLNTLSYHLHNVQYDPSTEYLYFTHDDKHHIIRSKMDGTGWQTYGVYGAGENQFNGSSDVFYDRATGYVYVVDSYNHRIVKATPDWN